MRCKPSRMPVVCDVLTSKVVAQTNFTPLEMDGNLILSGCKELINII